MNHDTRESVALLSRWALLALAGMMVLASGVALVGAAVQIARKVGAEISLSDGLWQSDHPNHVHVTGCVVGETSTAGPCVLLSSRRGRPGDIVPVNRRTIYPRLGDAGEGVHRLVVRGAPYDVLAFQQREALVVVVPPGREVYLIDASLAGQSLTRQPRLLEAVLDELGRRGTVAIFHTGGAEEVRGARSALADLTGEMPFLHPPYRTDDPTAVLWHTAWTLNRNDRKLNRNDKPGEVTVITADAGLADLARKAGFRVHQIHAAAARAPRGRAGGRFVDLAKFKEYLAARPIPKL